MGTTLILFDNSAFGDLEKGAQKAVVDLLSAANLADGERQQDGTSIPQPFAIGSHPKGGCAVWNEPAQHVGVVLVAGGKAQCIYLGFKPGFLVTSEVDQRWVLGELSQKYGVQLVKFPAVVEPSVAIEFVPPAPEPTLDEMIALIEEKAKESGLYLKVLHSQIDTDDVVQSEESQEDKLKRVRQEAEALGFSLIKKPSSKRHAKNPG